MPSKAASGAPRGRPKGTKSKPVAPEPDSSNPFATSSPEPEPDTVALDEEEAPSEKTIPKELLTRILHEFFAKDATRISRDANAAVGKYVDVFVREAIARAAVERRGGFLEASDS